MRGWISAGVLLLAGCAGSVAPGAPSPVEGAWVHRTMPVTYLEAMTLHVQGDSVTGEGTYMMEAGRAGKSRVGGTYRGGVLTLDITRDTGIREHFTGRVEAPGRLAGELRVGDGAPQPFGFEREQP